MSTAADQHQQSTSHFRRKILVVDDQPANVEILAELFDRHDIRVANSGRQALEVATSFRPDVVLLDVTMPGMDGYEVCRQIRENPVLRHTKIIIVSARALPAERLRGYEVGADDYVTKPFNQDELRAKVQVFLRLKSVEELHRLKSDVLTLLNHETRTPLTGIAAPVELLMSGEEMDTEARVQLARIAYSNVKQLQTFLEKVITLCAMRSGTWEFDLVPTGLRSLVRDAASQMKSKAAERNIEIVEQLDSNPIASVDQRQIHWTITAILDNAIRFSPTNGRITVGVSGDGAASVTITDKGDGIDPDFLPRVFDELSPADIRHHSEGQGISLALARQIVMYHGGTISARSSEGAGTTFEVRLPADTTPAPRVEAAYAARKA